MSKGQSCGHGDTLTHARTLQDDIKRGIESLDDARFPGHSLEFASAVPPGSLDFL